MERTPWHSSGVSLAIYDHTVLPAIRHKWTHPALTLARQASTRLTYRYPGGIEGWVDLDDLLHTEMVYPFADGHPSKYPSTNRAQCRLSTLIEAKALTTTLRRHRTINWFNLVGQINICVCHSQCTTDSVLFSESTGRELPTVQS